MTREEKQKAIDALKISAPVMAVTQEEFNDYIQTINKIMDWLEQEPVLNKIRAEIDRKAVYYETEVNTNIASGMYKAIDIIDKYKGARNEIDS